MTDICRALYGSVCFVVPETSLAIMNWVRDMGLRTSPKAALDCNRAGTTEDLRDELAKIALPTLVIHGDQDVTSPIDITARRTAELVPGATLKVYERAPHGLFVSHLDRLNADLLALVRGQI